MNDIYLKENNMRRVYKYPVPRRSAKFPVLLPANFRFLRIGFQAEELFMWAEVLPDTVQVVHNFIVVGTGHDIPIGAKYVTTYDDGPFVFHVYLLG